MNKTWINVKQRKSYAIVNDKGKVIEYYRLKITAVEALRKLEARQCEKLRIVTL